MSLANYPNPRTISSALDSASRCLQDASVFVRDQAATIESLQRALEDAISTYREDDKEVLVTAERIEAWKHALAESRK
jgi:phage host-nuclease inhibitor protein Gam